MEILKDLVLKNVQKLLGQSCGNLGLSCRIIAWVKFKKIRFCCSIDRFTQYQLLKLSNKIKNLQISKYSIHSTSRMCYHVCKNLLTFKSLRFDDIKSTKLPGYTVSRLIVHIFSDMLYIFKFCGPDFWYTNSKKGQKTIWTVLKLMLETNGEDKLDG